jgi:hypothetical protein
MDLKLVFVFVGMIILAAGSTWLAPRIWSGRYRPALAAFEAWLPSSIARGTIRALAFNPVFLWLAAAFMLAAGLRPIPAGGTNEPLPFLLALLAAAALGISGSIVFFNRPKSLVPPHMRSEPGAVAEWRKSIAGWWDRRRRRDGQRG